MPGYYPSIQQAHFAPMMMDSAWRAVHPPAYQFRHVATPSRPWTPLSMASVPPSPYAGSIRSQALYSASNSRSQSRAGSVNSHGLYYAPNGQVLRSSPSSRSLSSSRSTTSAGSRGYTPPGPRPRLGHQRSTSDITNTKTTTPHRHAGHPSTSSTVSSISTSILHTSALSTSSSSRPPTRSESHSSLSFSSSSSSPSSSKPTTTTPTATSKQTHHAQALESHLRNLQRRKELKKKLRAGKIDLDPFSGKERRRSLDTLPRAVRKPA